jgi:hypothetical protein
VTFRIRPTEAIEHLENIWQSLYNIEGFLEDAGFRDAKSSAYTARLRVSEAISSLRLSSPSEGDPR